MTQHKLFLRWLVYFVLVVFAVVAGWYFDIIPFILKHDQSYLTYAIAVFYVLTELYLGIQSFRISKELLLVNQGVDILSTQNLSSIEDDGDTIVIKHGDVEERLERSILVNHINNLLRRRAMNRVDQQALLNLAADQAFARSERGLFMADIITLLGLLGTMVGLIIAFFPFFEGDFDITRGQEILTHLFNGISVAFFTTATAIACSILIRVNAKHLESGLQELIDSITVISETSIIPVIERMSGDVEQPLPAGVAQ